jgi:tRNA(fMet)-specific endonuclease VapC
MEALIFDTTFLIDFQRERRQGQGNAHIFLEAHTESLALLPVAAYGEFTEGFECLDDPNLINIVDSFEILPVTQAVGTTYAQLTRKMRRQGTLIGANDLWIAATAVEKQLPLVTRNVSHFARFAGLVVLGY